MTDIGNARLVTLIETTLYKRGEGVIGDAVRIVTQWWDLDGKLVVEKDPYEPTPPVADVIPND